MSYGTMRRPRFGVLLALIAAGSVGIAAVIERPPAAPAGAVAKATLAPPSCDLYAGGASDGASLPDQNFARHPRCMA